jgi:hypothetical protein
MVLATALTLASVGSQLLGAGMSFGAARKQKKLQSDAEAEAEAAMNAARKSLEINYMDSLAIQKEPYELERDAALVAGAQATEALRESDRGMGRVGAIYGQQQQAQRQIASAMGQEMFNLDYLSTQEDTRLRDIGTQLDLGEVTGAQLAAANAEERRAQQLQAGVQGIGGAAMTGLDQLNLYKKTNSPMEAKVNTTSLTQTGETPLDRLDAMKKTTDIKIDPFAPDTSRRALPPLARTPGQLPKIPGGYPRTNLIPPVDPSLLTPLPNFYPGVSRGGYMIPPEQGMFDYMYNPPAQINPSNKPLMY